MSPEQALIQEVFAPLAAAHEGAASLRDDAAIYRPGAGCDIVITMDSLVAGVHFLADDRPDLVARKALRVNLSDLAAKGAAPAAYLLSVALTSGQEITWLRQFADGLASDQRDFGCVLIGGDTISTPGPLTITITAFGELPCGGILRRGGARAGDLLYVSGSIGDAALGLRVIIGKAEAADAADAEFLSNRYWLPQPRVSLAPVLRRHATAAMDISDGLIGDLALMCQASSLTARLDAHRVPLSDAARRMVDRDPGRLELCLTGGDDYEILCAVPPEAASAFERDCADAGIPVTCIGAFAAGEAPPLCLDADGRPMTFMRTSYSHIG